MPIFYIILFVNVIRKSDTVPDVAPPMVREKSCYEDHGYYEKELITRYPNNQPHLNEDIFKIYCYIEETRRTTRYAVPINPY